MKFRNHGFSLLEAIVAMVLISGTGMTLFSWINSSIASLARIQEANARAEATTNILEYMERVNPMITPEGKAMLGEYTVRWKTKAITNPGDGANYPRGVSIYQLALYLTDVNVTTEQNRDWFRLQLQQVGYKKVRSLSLD